jgi:hypothetical protein
VSVQSYLPETIGGVIVAATFADDHLAQNAVDVLHSSGVRPQDISVIARDRTRATLLAADKAWTPWRNEPTGRLAKLIGAVPLPGRGLPKQVRKRYGAAIAAGHIVVVVAAGGQPPDTLEALLTQAGGTAVESWWSKPVAIFAPPELAGPF